LQLVFGVARRVETAHALGPAMAWMVVPMAMATSIIRNIGHDSMAR